MKRLRELGFEVTGYWYNPNVHPYSEHERRRETLAQYALDIDLAVIWGGALLVAALISWRWSGLLTATLSRDLLGTYLCAGVFTMLLWQVFQNVGMTLGIMPVTGLPLPFISYGGSSLVVCLAGSGALLNVSQHA